MDDSMSRVAVLRYGDSLLVRLKVLGKRFKWFLRKKKVDVYYYPNGVEGFQEFCWDSWSLIPFYEKVEDIK